MLTLSIAPEFSFVTTDEVGGLVSDFGAAIVQRRETSPRIRRRFKLQWRNLRKSEKDELVALFRSTRGSAVRFQFTPPDEATPVVVRFVSGSLAWEQRTGSQYAASVEIREV